MPGVSWALKESLAGAVVIHFVSHAWAEGVFEFYRSLKKSWENAGLPHDAAAYICFLSNPQNLDIRSMLATIHTSPFHVALQHMPADGKMILIATENAAIHTRLWCVFEAYTAMERGLAIEVAGDRLNLALDRVRVLVHQGRINRCVSVLYSLMLCVQTYLAAQGRSSLSVEQVQKRATGCLRDVMERPITNCCSSILGIVVMALLTYFLHWWFSGLVLAVMLLLLCAQGFLFMGRAHFRRLAVTGSFLNVRDAECSSAEDAERIRQVVAGKEDEISALIGNLIFNF
eukprot:s627_g26.t1